MDTKSIRRLAADILKVGEERVYISPDHKEELASAMTRADVKELIKNGVIKKKPVKGKKRGELRKRKGPGRRKGKKYSRKSRKEHWMERVRALRKLLFSLIKEGKLDKQHKKGLYLKIKGNIFRGKKSFLNYLKEHKLLGGGENG